MSGPASASTVAAVCHRRCANGATHSYLANRRLVDQISSKQNGTARMTTTKQWGHFNRLTSISSVPWVT